MKTIEEHLITQAFKLYKRLNNKSKVQSPCLRERYSKAEQRAFIRYERRVDTEHRALKK